MFSIYSYHIHMFFLIICLLLPELIWWWMAIAEKLITSCLFVPLHNVQKSQLRLQFNLINGYIYFMIENRCCVVLVYPMNSPCFEFSHVCFIDGFPWVHELTTFSVLGTNQRDKDWISVLCHTLYFYQWYYIL